VSKNMTKSDGTRQRGQALVELAFILPLLVLLMVGAIELGRFCYAAIEVSNAAGAGARDGAQNYVTAYDFPGMQRAAVNDGPNVSGLTAATPPPQRICYCSDGSASSCSPTACAGLRLIMFVQVNTTATVSSMFQYPGIPRSITLQGQAIMRVAE
jgi:Flp pilus assembly protein TadG